MNFHRFLRTVVARRYWLLAVALIGGVGALAAGRQLTMDRSIENMFANDDPILQPYRRMQRTFGEHEIVLAVYEDQELTSDAGRQRIEDLSAELRGIDGVVAVVSLLDLPGAADFDNDGVGRQFREVFAGYTHNSELDAAGVLCLIERPQGDGARRRATLAKMRAAAARYPRGVVVGEPVLIQEAFDLLELDGFRLNTWCTLLVLLTVFACFRQLRWMILPLAVVQLALAATRATLVAANLQLSMVSSMLAAIVTVIGVATVVHFIVRYQQARVAGRLPRRAVVRTLQQLAVPVTFTCLTDMAGFAALMISDVGPVRDFGLMMAIGSIWILPCALLLTPGITLLAAWRPTPPPAQDGYLAGPLESLLAWSRRHATALACGAAIVTIVSLFGARKLQRETVFTKNFRADSDLVQSYEFVEQRFGGAGVWDIQMPAPRRLTKQYVVNLASFEQELRSEAPALTKAISLADTLDAGAGGLEQRRFGGELAVRTGTALLRKKMPEFVNATYHADPDTGEPWLRVMLRAPEHLEADQKSQLIEQVSATAAAKHPESEVTGYYVLLNKLIESVLADQWTAFGIAAAAILAMMTVAFGSWKLSLAAMIPNTLPVLVLFGAMGWLGIRVNMGAAMIAAVSIGLSVDGSIHYITDYLRRRRRGLSADEALTQVQETVGRAAVLSTLALVVGFSTLATSDFVPTIYFGALVSLSMIGGLLGNLAILPMLIGVIDGKVTRPRPG